MHTPLKSGCFCDRRVKTLYVDWVLIMFNIQSGNFGPAQHTKTINANYGTVIHNKVAIIIIKRKLS